MEKIDINTNSNKIQQAYDKVVRGDPNATFVVYSVDKTPLWTSLKRGRIIGDFVEHLLMDKFNLVLARLLFRI